MTGLPQACTVLVVEDDTLNLVLAEEILKLDGYRTMGAASAEQAQQRIVKQLPDLILLDVRLPGTDGLTLLRRLRSSPITRDLPIIALTAQAMPDDIAMGLAAGFDAYVVKPIEPAQLLDTVRVALAQHVP